jgi:hypothetical protein
MHHSTWRQALLIGALVWAGAATAEPVVRTFDLSTSFGVSAFNDRIGNSRFFTGPNTDRIRVSAFVFPTPDSDRLPFLSGGVETLSDNGAFTTATVSHPSLAARDLTWVGLTSGLGGGRNEFTTTFNRASLAAQLDALDATPFTVTVRNPRAPNVQEVSRQAPDFDKNALPPFVTDVALTGNGINPTISWSVPDGSPVPLTNISIQVRRIEAESADRTRITRSTLVHSRSLAVSARSYTFDEMFSNAGVPGFPSGLEIGRQYEISVQLETASGGVLKGRSRTFFELTPLTEGGNAVKVFLPSVGPNGVFKFDVAVKAGEKIKIDPVVAIGYDYQIGAGDPLFASVELPDVGDGLYELWLWDGSAYRFESALAAGQEFRFAGAGADRFRVLGIEAGAGLNPADVAAFVTTISFAGDGRFTGTMTPITIAIPLPGTLALAALGLAGLAFGRRRTSASAH